MNGPVFALMFGGLGLAVLLSKFWQPGYYDQIRAILIIVTSVGGFIGAWIWWSWSVPQWRIWALQNCSDWNELRQDAIKDGLIWPDGSVFEKTEWKSASQRTTERILRRIRESEG